MVVSEGAINNIMGGMENTAGVRLHSHRHKLKQRFDIVRKLGQGTYGKVQLAINKETGQEVAIKTIKKAKIETEQDLIRIRREIQIMSSVQQPQIIHIYEVFENREKMVLVMEYAAGGELYDYLSERKVLPEEEARRVFRQVASAVYYCHKHKICHRDLKLENILLDSEGNAKIADFGLSNVFDDKHRLDTFCGSPLYASPEIVKGVPYVGPEVDCWSLGVLLYTLVYGAMPFDGSNFRRLVKQITQGDFYEPATPASASELIRHMLTVKASERATVEDICNHWWVNEGYKTNCLKEAEKLASQTPVRLDLLLSLAPKHINSEHMLIQADGQPEVGRQDEIRSGDQSSLGVEDIEAAAPPRSHSVGAIPPGSAMNIDLLIEKKRKERQSSDEKKRQAEDSTGTIEKKKKKSSSKKISSRLKDEDSPIDKEEKAKKKESSSEREGKATDPEKKKSTKKRDSSATRELKGEKEKKKTLKKKESKKVEESPSLKPPLPPNASQPSSSENLNENISETLENRMKRSDSKQHRHTPSPTPSTDVTLKASDSSISRPSVSPSLSKLQQNESLNLLPKAPSPSKDFRVTRQDDPSDTEKILLETAAKIEAVEAALALEGKSLLNDDEPPAQKVESAVGSLPESAVGSPPSSKNSVVSSQVTSPTRSRTGSESSTETNRPSRGDAASRRHSKIFSKAAMFDNMAAQNSRSPPPEKPKKVPRPGGLTLSDISKRFEEKPVVEKKTKIVTPFKVSDARRAFENKAEKSQTNTPSSKGSSISEGDSLPTSPTRMEKSGSVSANRSGSSSKSGSMSNDHSESLPANKVAPTKPQKEVPSQEIAPEQDPPKEASVKKVLKSQVKSTSPAKKDNLPSVDVSRFDRSPSKDKENVQPEQVTKLKDRPRKEEKVQAPQKIILKNRTPVVTESKYSVGSRVTEGKKTPSKSEVRTIEIKLESSESSDSESEAERMLKSLTEKREKLEQVKAEKLRKVSEVRDRELAMRDMPAIKEESRTPTPGRHIDTITPGRPPELADTKFATLPRGFKAKVSVTPVSATDEYRSSEPSRKKTQMQIILSNKPMQASSDSSRSSSYKEIPITSPTSKDAPRQPEFRTEARHNVGGTEPQPAGPPPHHREPQLQRARRERIIPIMLEEEDDDTLSGSYPPSSFTESTSSGASIPPARNYAPPAQIPTRVAPTLVGIRNFSPEPIKKSPRERIIPISVEGEGILTPPVVETPASDAGRPMFQRPLSHQAHFNRGRTLIDRSESFSSAGEDDDDEEDGFQILTAESLFSTLLSRVRSLTRKMNDDPRGDRFRRGPLTREQALSGGPGAGFWSSLCTSPRDTSSGRISDNLSRGSLSRDEDPFGNFGAPLWNRSLSREPSDSDSVFSESSTSFSTLPRGQMMNHP